MTHIWVPKFKILEPRREINLPVLVGGRFQLQSYGPDGRPRRRSAWFHNLITNAGLDTMGTGGAQISIVAVGTGNAAPNVADTALGAQVASTGSLASESRGQNSSSPYELTKTVTYRFGTGAAEGNLTEVGIGGATDKLFSRELIRDSGGNPITFPVAADEQLDVTYQVQLFPPLVDVEDTITITGSGSHDILMRASSVVSGWDLWGGGGTLAPGSQFMSFAAQSGTAGHRAFDADIGAITGEPGGASSNADSAASAAYSNGSFFRDHTLLFGLARGNFVGGIRSVQTTVGSTGSQDTKAAVWQCQYDPRIAKDDSQVLTLTFRTSWGRV